MSIQPKFDTKAPKHGIPGNEIREMYGDLGTERYAVVCIESVERTEKLDFEADDSVKLRITAIELPPSDDDQAELVGLMRRHYTARTADGTLDGVLDAVDGMTITSSDGSVVGTVERVKTHA